MADYRILTLNSISEEGLQRLPSERYAVGSTVAEPDAIMVRSANVGRWGMNTRLSRNARDAHRNRVKCDPELFPARVQSRPCKPVWQMYR